MKIWAKMRGRIFLQDGRQGNSIEKSTKISERDQRTRRKFLQGTRDPGRCWRNIRFLPCALYLLHTSSPSSEGEAVINTCVYSSTTFPPSSPPVSARHLCLEAPRSLNFLPCVCVRMTLPVISLRSLFFIWADTDTSPCSCAIEIFAKFSARRNVSWICILWEECYYEEWDWLRAKPATWENESFSAN